MDINDKIEKRKKRMIMKEGIYQVLPLPTNPHMYRNIDGWRLKDIADVMSSSQSDKPKDIKSLSPPINKQITPDRNASN
jgi:hypothetical protein